VQGEYFFTEAHIVFSGHHPAHALLANGKNGNFHDDIFSEVLTQD
jgi:hypothetical protein